MHKHAKMSKNAIAHQIHSGATCNSMKTLKKTKL